MNIRLLLLLSNFFSVAALFGQAQDSLLQLLQRQVRELKVQRSQDSLKVNVLSQELQALLLLDTKHADTSKDSLYKKQRQEEIKRIYSKANGAPVCLEKGYTLYCVYKFRTQFTFGAIRIYRKKTTKISRTPHFQVRFSQDTIP